MTESLRTIKATLLLEIEDLTLQEIISNILVDFSVERKEDHFAIANKILDVADQYPDFKQELSNTANQLNRCSEYRSTVLSKA